MLELHTISGLNSPFYINEIGKDKHPTSLRVVEWPDVTGDIDKPVENGFCFYLSLYDLNTEKLDALGYVDYLMAELSQIKEMIKEAKNK